MSTKSSTKADAAEAAKGKTQKKTVSVELSTEEVTSQGPRTAEGTGTPFPHGLCHLDLPSAKRLHQQPGSGAEQEDGSTSDSRTALSTVKVVLLGRGNPLVCARIYRLPAGPSKLRHQWLQLKPEASQSKTNRKGQHAPAPKTPNERRRALAASLLATASPELSAGPVRAGMPDYPMVPGEEDLIGFITTGNFSLSEGKGVGIGCIVMAKALEVGGKAAGPGDKRQCVVRNAGTALGYLAQWSLV
ncbi:MAG: hypothetical protein M1826_002157 [Phylliscum demangeonii]|nr:MAG: hypothetical protein M1826_002157 [Phylliscum demangeonii]